MYLPDLTPTDVRILHTRRLRYQLTNIQSHSVWYASTHGPTPALESTTHGLLPSSAITQSLQSPAARRALHRTPHNRLRHEEELVLVRKTNVRNYGSYWLRPPGCGKSLFQMREEKREAEEQAEQMRREHAAQLLADAEAQAADEAARAEGLAEMEADAEDLDAVDLDDELPDMDAEGFGGGMSSQDEEEEEEDEEQSEEEDHIQHNDDIPTNHRPSLLDHRRQLGDTTPRTIPTGRIAEDAYREAMMRDADVRASTYTSMADGDGDATDDEDQSGMLQEEDLVHERRHRHTHRSLDADMDMDMDMGHDLDADIPDAEDEYEHTDTEEELSSSDVDGDVNINVNVTGDHARSQVRSDGTQNSLDMSSAIGVYSDGLGSPRAESGAGAGAGYWGG